MRRLRHCFTNPISYQTTHATKEKSKDKRRWIDTSPCEPCGADVGRTEAPVSPRIQPPQLTSDNGGDDTHARRAQVEGDGAAGLVAFERRTEARSKRGGVELVDGALHILCQRALGKQRAEPFRAKARRRKRFTELVTEYLSYDLLCTPQTKVENT